jgi:hypothetical protein
MSQIRAAASATLHKKRTSRVRQSGRSTHKKSRHRLSLSLSLSLALARTRINRDPQLSKLWGVLKQATKGYEKKLKKDVREQKKEEDGAIANALLRWQQRDLVCAENNRPL